MVARLWLLLAALVAETLLLSYLVQFTPVDDVHGAARVVRDAQHWLFRLVIAYVASFAVLAHLRRARVAAAWPAGAAIAWRPRWLAVHGLLLLPMAWLSATLYGDQSLAAFACRAAAWHAIGIGAVAALCAGIAPLPVWRAALRPVAGLALFAWVPACLAVLLIGVSQLLWAPAAELTFRLVAGILTPVLPGLHTDPRTLTLFAPHFAVTVTAACSGLEGVGLMLAFCTAWLWYFRDEYRFPRALVVLPAGVLLVFALNVLRIAGLLLIGNAGHRSVAMIGFHSQAGWIGFNAAAFSVAYAARGSAWLSRSSPAPRARTANPVAPLLMPFLAILAAGFLARAMSAQFDYFYALRLIAALAMLWLFRRRFGGLDFAASWRAPAVGILVFAVWIGYASIVTTHAGMPEALRLMSPAARAVWIGTRLAAALLTVPIAEELAFRGYLMRRLVAADFTRVPLGEATPWAVIGSSALFALMHGGFWAPGMLAGLAYALLAKRTGKIGEAILAHATTNALVAAGVLVFGEWQLW